ncbi:MAG: hypothetical protein IJM59_10875 [Proteobacteria bacterium]|nr:hypothetical protein [Pseudomonadota bacterium]
MRIKSLIIILVPLVLTSCEMASVVEWGSDCPGNSETGKLSYIGDEYCNAENTECHFFDTNDKESVYDFSIHFRLNRCPNEYPKCVNEDDTYHCEAQTNCAPNQFACELETGSTLCVDPASTSTCGAQADKCNEEYFGGQDCSMRGSSICAYRDGEYSCQCASGAKLCGSYCLSPAANETCGANDCDADNYGGDDCTEYEDVRTCRFSDGKYSCQCRDGDIMCDGKCVTPSTDPWHCGAKGACTSDDPEDDDYSGTNCDSGNGICSAGLCKCTSGQIWCSVNGEEQPRCVSPYDPETCGAQLLYETEECESIQCKKGQSCSFSNDTFSCIQVECEESEHLCKIDGVRMCTPLSDPNNCGTCGMKCERRKGVHAHGNLCKSTGDDDYDCTLLCDEGYTNCKPDDDFDPECVDLNRDLDNCGECGKSCSLEESCIDGICKKTECLPTQCATKDANNKAICMNMDFMCGANCDNCFLIDEDSKCNVQQGKCAYTKCKNNQHPIYSGDQIVSCEDNSASACAPSASLPNDPIVDCNASKPANVSSMDCSSDGTCIPVACAPGYHLNGHTCEANSKTACGSTDGAVKSCLGSHVEDANCNNNGECIVTQCASGYHIHSNLTSCVQNSTEACAPPNRSDTTNCNTLSNVESAKCTSQGTCQVTNCKSGYHITDATQSSCSPTSASSCAATNSYSVKDCTTSYKKSCSGGTCVCASGVENYDNTACVNEACKGVPGIQSGNALTKSWFNHNYSDYACNATSCLPGYKRQQQNNTEAWTCLPPSSQVNCGSLGYLYTSSDGHCIAQHNGKNGHAHCKDNYRHYILACLHKDVCCGTRNTSMSLATDFLCTNCLAQGKTCNISSGKCQ